MPKSRNTFYFDHDYSARNDQKILMLRAKYGIEAYGIYWCLIESMAEDTNGYLNREAIGGLSIGYGVPADNVQAVIDYCVEVGLLKTCEHGNIYSQRMLDHKKHRTKYVDSGLKGAEIRWGNREANSHANRGGSRGGSRGGNRVSNILEERRGEYIKEKSKREFSIPTLDDVRSYCLERKNLVSPEKWFDYYTSNGWKVGKNQMKDWRAAVRTWERSEYGDKTGSTSVARPQTAFMGP